MINVIKKYIEENKKEAAAIFAICAAALVLRLISLFCAGDLWLDEIYSYYFSSKNSVIDVIRTLYTEDLHTPLYFVLLHFWIKFFNIFNIGENDTVMRLLGFIPAFLTVPLAFFAGKTLFNRKTGYFAAIMLAISPFAIYYSTELRFYGFVLFLSLLSSFFFVKYVNSINSSGELNPEKLLSTNALALIISNLALLYTFNISFVFVFFQFLCGLLFVIDKKTFFKTYVLTGLLYIPAFIMTAHGIFAYKNAICSFAQDIFIYKPKFISIFLQSYFTGSFYYALNNMYQINDRIISEILKPKQLFLVLFPALFCLTGFFRAVFDKYIHILKEKILKKSDGERPVENKNLLLFLLPSLAFLLFELIFAHFGLMSLIVRYTIVSYPAIIIVCAFGLSLMKPKKLLCGLFLAFVVSVSFFLFSKEENVIKKETLFGTPVEEMFGGFQIRQDDYIIVPMMGKLYKRYLPKNATYIDFEVTDMLLNDVRKYFPLVFDSETIENLNRKNARTLLKDFVIDESINPVLEEHFKTQYFDKMKKGQAFIVVVYDINTVKMLNRLYILPKDKRDKLYEVGGMYYFLSAKITLDTLEVANKYLKSLKAYTISSNKSSGDNTGVFVFLKN